jgi:hypothetical protein
MKKKVKSKFLKNLYPILGIIILLVAVAVYSISVRSNMTGNVACNPNVAGIQKYEGSCIQNNCYTGIYIWTCRVTGFLGLTFSNWQMGACVENPSSCSTSSCHMPAYKCAEDERCDGMSHCLCKAGLTRDGVGCITNDCYNGIYKSTCSVTSGRWVTSCVKAQPIAFKCSSSQSCNGAGSCVARCVPSCASPSTINCGTTPSNGCGGYCSTGTKCSSGKHCSNRVCRR